MCFRGNMLLPKGKSKTEVENENKILSEWKENHENRNAKGDAQMKPLKTGDPCPCCGMPIKSTNPEMLRLLTDIRDFGFSLRDAERVAALLKKEQEAADGTM